MSPFGNMSGCVQFVFLYCFNFDTLLYPQACMFEGISLVVDPGVTGSGCIV